MARKLLNLNTSALVTQAIAVALALVSILFPHWLANPAGMSFYPYSRTWGLFYVAGREIRSHPTQWHTMCNIAGQMSIGVMCTSPLCKWYAQKCAAYQIVLIASYTTLGIVIASILLTVCSMVFSLRRSKKALRFSSGLALLGCALTFASTIIYIYLMGEAFSMINSVGYYPTPQPSVSFIFICVSSFLMGISCILHFIRFGHLAREANYIMEAKYEQQRVRQELGV